MRLVCLAAALATARAAPDTDTQLKRAAALARWVDRTGPAPPSWTVTSPKDVTVGREVHAGKIKKVYRGTTKADLGGSSIIIKTIEHGTDEKRGTLLMELLFLQIARLMTTALQQKTITRAAARGPARPGPAVRPRRAGSVSRARVRFSPKKHTSTTPPTGRGCSLTSRSERRAATGPSSSP